MILSFLRFVYFSFFVYTWFSFLLVQSFKLNNFSSTGQQPALMAIYGNYLYVANYGGIGRINLLNPERDNNQQWLSAELPVGLTIVYPYLYFGNLYNSSDFFIGRQDLRLNTNTANYTWSGPFLNSYPIFGLTNDNNNIYASLVNQIAEISILDSTMIQYHGATTLQDSFVSDLVYNDGFIYMSDSNNNLTYRSPIPLTDSSIVPFVGNLTIPVGLAINNGDLYIGQFTAGTIAQIPLDNPSNINYSWLTGLILPVGLVFSNNNLYISQSSENNIVRTPVPNPICFGKGTDILCVNPETRKTFYKKIEHLNKGDMVKTYKQGFKKVQEIVKGTMKNDPNVWHDCMYKMAKQPGMTNDLYVTGGHSILVNKDEIPVKVLKKQFPILGGIATIEDKYMWLASECPMFEPMDNNETYTYYHFSLEHENEPDRKHGVWANGVLTETASENQIRGGNPLVPVIKRPTVSKKRFSMRI